MIRTDSVMPEEKVRKHVPNQAVIFKSNLISSEKKEFIFNVLFQGVFLTLLLIISLMLLLGLYDPEDLMRIILSYMLGIMGTFVFTIIMIDQKKKRYYIIITSKELIRVPHHSMKHAKKLRRPLSSIRWIFYKTSFFKKRRGFGDVVVESNKKQLTIKNIPAVKQFQVILESLLFYHGNVQNKWEEIKARGEQGKENMFPMEYAISPTQSMLLSRVLRKYIYRFIILQCGIITILVIISIFIYGNIYLSLYMYMIIIIVSAIFSIILINTPARLIRRFPLKNRSLVMKEQEINVRTKNSTDTIAIQKGFTLNTQFRYGLNVKTSSRFIALKSIRLKPSIDSKECLTFGIVDNFTDMVEAIHVHSIISKQKQGFLVSLFELNNQVNE